MSYVSPNRESQPTDANNFVNALSQTLAAANAYLTALLREAGLANLVPSHGEILMQLFAKGTVGMQDLAAAIGRDPSTVTALIRKLAEAGYVETQKNPSDKRVTDVRLTDKGMQMKDDFASISVRLRTAQLEGIDDAEFDRACKVLDDIRGNFISKIEENSRKERA